MPMKSSPKVSIIDCTLVFFVLETSESASNNKNILQIAAKTEQGVCFDTFIHPQCKIPWNASKVNGITAVGSNLFQHRKPVKSEIESEGTKLFMEFLEKQNTNVVLVAHNLFFHLDFLYTTAHRTGFSGRLEQIVKGGICSHQMSRSLRDNDNKLVTLAEEYLLPDDAYEGRRDAKIRADELSKIYPILSTKGNPEEYSMTMQFYVQRWNVVQKFKTLTELLEKDGAIKQPLVEAIAERGLDYCKLVEMKNQASNKAEFVSCLKELLRNSKKGKNKYTEAASALFDNLT